MSGKLTGFLRSNLIALVALFIALGGTSYAATRLPANSVGTKQIKSAAVTTVKIKNDAVTGAQVRESSLSQVPAAAQAVRAANADNAANSTHWGGVSSSVLGTTLLVMGDSFQPLSSTIAWSLYGSGGMRTTTASASFLSQVQLPQGASVTKMTFYYFTGAAATPGSVALIRSPMNDLASTIVGLSPAVTSGTGYGSASVTLSTPAVIDNTAYGYTLQWLAPAATPANGILMGVRLDYTLP